MQGNYYHSPRTSQQIGQWLVRYRTPAGTIEQYCTFYNEGQAKTCAAELNEGTVTFVPAQGAVQHKWAFRE